MSTNDNERLTLTIPECARVLGISLGLAYELAGRNELPIQTIRCGRRLLVARKAVEALLSGDGRKEENGQDSTK